MSESWVTKQMLPEADYWLLMIDNWWFISYERGPWAMSNLTVLTDNRLIDDWFLILISLFGYLCFKQFVKCPFREKSCYYYFDLRIVFWQLGKELVLLECPTHLILWTPLLFLTIHFVANKELNTQQWYVQLSRTM